MTSSNPTVVLVHGAFADSSSWDGVARELTARDRDVVSLANPLRSVQGDAAYLRDFIAGLGTAVVLVGHSYGGMVITEAASDNDAVKALVFVAAFAPAPGESALELSGRHPGSTLGDTLFAYPVSSGGNEFRIDPEKFPDQFAADVDPTLAAAMAISQRPVTEKALSDTLSADTAAWKDLPSWFVFGDADKNIPVEALREMAKRADSKGTREVPGGSHAVGVSQPRDVTASIEDALSGL
ncbi:alpha/beta hydrolase [Frondihabitans peucedani]|uniref:Alpha/beta hydrolase n=1 Tax=Frondihabitans peucedani TaxID=598626 RepID=A0ABP8E1D3_9MICO